MRLASTAVLATLLLTGGCENLDLASRRPSLPGNVDETLVTATIPASPEAGAPMTEEPPPAAVSPGHARDEIIYPKGGRPILPTFAAPPVINLKNNRDALTEGRVDGDAE